MKTLIIIMSLIMSNYALAVPASIITQILSDSEVSKLLTGTSISKIEETSSFRCLGCYRVVISQNTPVGQQLITVDTQAVGPGKVEVSIISVTK